MRIALGTSLQSRDGTLTKDAKVMNGLLESTGPDTPPRLRKRPGVRDAGTVNNGAAGTPIAQLLTFWNGLIFALQHDTMMIGCITTTWNPNDKSTTVSLSGGNLVVTGSFAGGTFVRAAISVTPPLVGTSQYAEFTAGVVGASWDIGMANATESVEVQLGSTANSINYMSAGVIRKGGANLASVATYSSGDVIGILYDSGANTILFYKNDTLVYTASGANVPSGSLYMAAGPGGGGTTTANFGANAYLYTTHRSAATWMRTGGTTLTVLSRDLPFSAQDNGANAATPYLMLKSREKAWTVNGSNTVTAITDVDYPGTYTVTLTGITRSGSTATATTAEDVNFQAGSKVTIAGAGQSEYNGIQTVLTVVRATPEAPINPPEISITITRSGTTATAVCVSEPHGLTNGQSVTISGSEQSEYNGVKAVTYISPTSFSFTVTVTAATAASPASPATGSPAIQSNAVNGVPYTNRWYDYAAQAINSDDTKFQSTVFFGPNSGDQMYRQGATVALTNSSINGSYTITSRSSQYFYFTKAGQVGAASGTATTQVSVASISSITHDGFGTATVTTGSAHTLVTGDRITITGATQTEYNMVFVAIVLISSTSFSYQIAYRAASAASPATPATGTIVFVSDVPAQIVGASFTYAVTGTPATPATGTITATAVRYTVPGIAYLDGYFCVMDEQGVIYNSAEDDPSTWIALEYELALAETGAGVAIARSLRYVIAFKEWSTEYFFDNANDVGSPLSAQPDMTTLVGCASGYSLAEVGGKLLWISQSKKQKGRGIYMMMGPEQQKVSTEDIDRILNADDLADVEAMGITLDAHPCYLLRLGTTGITLVYDLMAQAWGQFTSYTIGSSKSVSSITLSGTTATATFAVPHTLTDGDPCLFAGAVQTEYNGVKQVSFVSTTIVTFEVTGTPATPATGTITGTPYTESYFKFVRYASCAGKDIVLHKSDGHIYEVLPSLYQDAGLPINVFARTERLDGGSMRRKKMPRIGIACTPVSDFAMVRWSDDDCVTYDAYRSFLLSDVEPNTRRCGGFQRRTLEYRHIGNTAPVIDALELEVSQ